MSRSSRTARGPRATPLLALLLLTMLLAALLVYEAAGVVRSHQATAARAVREYASLSARDFLAAAMVGVRDSFGAALAPVTERKASSPFEPLPSPALLEASAARVLPCDRPADDASRTYFRVALEDRALVTSGGAPDAGLRRWLVDTIVVHAARAFQPDARFAVLLGTGALADRAVLYGVKYAQYGAPLAAYGLVTCASALGSPLFRPLMQRYGVWPSAARAGAPVDSLLWLGARDGSGRELFRSSADAPPPAGLGAIADIGGVTVRAALRPAAVAGLIASGGSPSRLPLLLGLLALTAGLALVALAQMRREQELARLRADFTSSVSHELRTPLAQILLFGETLSMGRVRSDEERRVAAETIVHETRRLIHMVENVLHFARGERGVATLDARSQALAPLLRSVIDAFMPLAHAAGVELRADLDERVTAVTDASALRQIVLNLLDNAVKYGPGGQTVVVGADRRDDVARIWVEDEGPGIPPQDRERIWIPFVRVDRASARGGSGIGLAVVRELTMLHGGTVRAETAAGGGSRFVVELPIRGVGAGAAA